MNSHTSQSILDKIKKENIKPTGKWYFILRQAVLWVPGILVTILGAHAIAGILYAFEHSGWEYREFVYSSQKDFLMGAFPLLWLGSFLLFSALIVKALRTTHVGYRFSLKNILLGSLLSSLGAGFGLYIADETFGAESIIRYPVHIREQQVWSSPSVGRIAGIIEEKDGSMLRLRDVREVIWDIDMSGFGTTTFPFVEEGKSIRIIGTSTEEERTFIACAVFPWEIGGFERKPLPAPQKRITRTSIISGVNKSPDCELVLEEIRRHIGYSERK